MTRAHASALFDVRATISSSFSHSLELFLVLTYSRFGFLVSLCLCISIPLHIYFTSLSPSLSVAHTQSRSFRLQPAPLPISLSLLGCNVYFYLYVSIFLCMVAFFSLSACVSSFACDSPSMCALPWPFNTASTVHFTRNTSQCHAELAVRSATGRRTTPRPRCDRRLGGFVGVIGALGGK